MRTCGTYAKYKLDGCRCYRCAAKASEYNINRERAIAYGTWNPFMDAEPVRAHIKHLSECGIGTRRIAALTGVSRTLLKNLLNGKPGKEPTRRVRTENAQRLLALEPTLENVAPSTPVDSAGSHRRLQALVTIGWSQQKLAERLGLTPSNFGTMLRSNQVSAARALEIRALYNQMWDQAPPETTHREKIAASRARNYAKARKWLPPMAWDDNLLDLSDDDLAAELERQVAAMDDAELAHYRHARYRLGEVSPLVVAAAREHTRRANARRDEAAA
jgi:transcriptional regulator with XRE-family HTH domain